MGKVVVQYFDGVELDVDFPPETEMGHKALATFLAMNRADRLAATKHVYAYYRDTHTCVGGEDRIDAEMGIPHSPEDIWAHVRPHSISVEIDPFDGENTAYVVIEAECAWEAEHGLMLCFRNGSKLTKCGIHDGHLTNFNPFSDPKLVDIVYDASNPAFSTKLDA